MAMRHGAEDAKAGSYNTFLPGAGGKTIHCFWIYKDANPVGNQRQFLGLPEAIYRYNLYYAKLTAEGKWTAADGTEMTEPPADKPWSDEHARILDSGEEFVTFKRTVIDESDTPYVYVEQGIEDWATKQADLAKGMRREPDTRIKVSLEKRFLTIAKGEWKTYNAMTEHWPERIRKLLLTPGPAVVSADTPSPWFIHYSLGRAEDPAKAFLWLEHIDKGPASRPEGPAAPPQDSSP